MNLHKLIKQGESETLEFKQSFDKEALITVCAFANHKGGDILIGVADNKKITGAQVGKETLKNWANQVSQGTEPRMAVNISEEIVDEKSIVVIRVPEYPVKPASVNGKCYIRVANSNRLLTIPEITEIHLNSINTSWDSFVAEGTTIEDIDLIKVKDYIRQAQETGRRKFVNPSKPLEVLQKIDLIKNAKPTWAAILLFSKDSSHFLKQARVHCGRFKQLSIIIDDKYIDGNIIRQVEETMSAIKKNINVRYVITGKPKRDEIWDYPLEALREAVLNSICHRDYRDSAEIIIKIYDDKISIWNPGRLPSGITLKELHDPIHNSKPRNPRIAEIFYDIGEIERYGSGIQRILDSCKEAKIPPPIFPNRMVSIRIVHCYSITFLTTNIRFNFYCTFCTKMWSGNIIAIFKT